MSRVSQGKRAASRRGAKPQRRFRPALLVYALGVTAAVLAWGYLVYAAIDFGAEARSGDSQAWAFLALASVGAVACLFIGLILVARLLRALGITGPPAPPTPAEAPVAAPPSGGGGRRAAR
jgi:hypothetical protein